MFATLPAGVRWRIRRMKLKPLAVRCSVGFLSLCQIVFAAEAPWEEQLREMGYHILHISALNAMNALNLSREQIVRLKALARKVEQVAPMRPSMSAELRPEWADVRQTYLDLSKVLMQGQEVPPALKASVFQARVKEAQVIRASLSASPSAQDSTSCSSCHVPPAARFSPAPTVSVEEASFLGKRFSFSGQKKRADVAHFTAVLGERGMQMVGRLAPQVDAILSESQKKIMEDFACCLIPPAALSDPVRAGQAEVSENRLQLLRRIRATPESAWPLACTNTINNLKGMYVAKNPGLTPAQIHEIESRLTDIFERARKMSDAEFEMNKDSLCAELEMKNAAPLTERLRRFKAAAFLLMPGSVEIYEALLKRISHR